MRTLVHLSDLHFGRIDLALVEPLITTIRERQPHLVVISGDLTQRARRREFEEARAFLEALPFPQVVVPGNHDVSLHNLYERFIQPLDKYRRYISADLEPMYADAEIVVLGVNTARSLTLKGGRINKRQIARLAERLAGSGDRIVKIVVTHHPFNVPETYRAGRRVGRARLGIETLARYRIDVLLAGHYHMSYSSQAGIGHKAAPHAVLTVQAGTAISTRGRGEANSFNILHIDRPHITVERWTWQPERAAFAHLSNQRFQDTPEGWVLAS